MKRGKLIVIDGSDGVGKRTQTELLINRLKKEKIKVATLDFPRYDENFFGSLIAQCLKGDFGDFISVDPHIASVLYAADRWESKEKIEKWLKSGTHVILNRYVSSNQMHQGGKIHSIKKREQFLSWLDALEHKVFSLPRPDGIIYLHLSVMESLQLMKKRLQNERKQRGAKLDLAEKNVDHLKNTQLAAQYIRTHNKNWHGVECDTGGAGPLPREVIHERVYTCYRAIIGKN